ncbi:MAG TPA: helix-turn-helix transcriptional regulator [Gemmatimonadales bacterium]|nr:helix-turn-helix transcriptional regulator [Gemmatimonadales bacterium]
MTRIFVAVADPARRAALLRLFRSDPSMRVVGTIEEADVVCRDEPGEPAGLAGAAARDLLPADAGLGDAVAGAALTLREAEVLRLVADGLANRAIGAALGITASTVKHHLATIFTKLDVSNRAEAVREGVRMGIVAL